MIGAVRQNHADVVAEQFLLFASNLSPACVIADDGDHRDAVTDEGVNRRRRQVPWPPPSNATVSISFRSIRPPKRQ
jgi:hypothetical protein